MTTVAQYQEAYHWHSGKASDISRQLGYAGIALVWLFKTQTANTVLYALPAKLALPVRLIALALALDLFQYVWQAILWGFVWRHFERTYGLESIQEFEISKYWNWPSVCIFWAKLCSMLLGYAALVDYLFKTVTFGV
jgi:hypothetical protein